MEDTNGVGLLCLVQTLHRVAESKKVLTFLKVFENWSKLEHGEEP